jgi:mycothiol synthase
MGFTRFDQLTTPRLPPGYGLRTYRPGDEDDWLAILATGDFGDWGRERLDRILAGERAPMPVEGVFFATREDRPVGAACAFLYQDERGEFSELGWVAVRPEHRGHGLGIEVCRAVLGFARERGHKYAYLKTEEYRLTAIRTYLRLGFEPEMIDPSHPAWWEKTRRTLGL